MLKVKELLFDVFGTVVDWWTGIAREVEVVAKMPDKTMKSTASNAGDNVFIFFDLSLFIWLKRYVIKIQRVLNYF